MSEDLDALAAEVADQAQTLVVAVTEIARGDDPVIAVPMLLLEMSQVMLAGARLGALRDLVPEERFEPDAGFDPDVDELRVRLAALLGPVDEYREIFDPYGPPDAANVTARLSDDVSGVVADLVHGLQHYRDGRVVEALWWWQFSYLSSWGATAGAALRALHSVVAHSRLDTDRRNVSALEDRLLADTATDAVATEVEPGRLPDRR